MVIDPTIKLSDVIVGLTILVAAVRLIITNRDILRNVIRMVGDHEKRLNHLSAIVDEHDDIIIRNGLDLRADRNLTRRHRASHPNYPSMEPEKDLGA